MRPEVGDAGPSVVYFVRGSATGECTVTVTFTDGTPEQVEHYTFVGRERDCCEKICVKGGGAYTQGYSSSP